MLTEPIHDALNAGLFTKALHVLAVGGLAGSKGGSLCQSVAMGDEGVVDPLANTAIGDGVWGGVISGNPFATKVIVRVNGHDDGDLGAFWNIGQPKRHVHQGGTGKTSVLFTGGKFNLNKVLFVGQGLVGSVHGELSPKRVHGEVHRVAFTQRCVPPLNRVIRAFFHHF